MLTISFLIISLFFPNISKLIVDAAEKECSANPADSNSDRGEKRPHASTQGKKLNFPYLRQKLEHIMNSKHEIGLSSSSPPLEFFFFLVGTYTLRHPDEAPTESHETAQTSGGRPMKPEAMLIEEDFPHMQNHRRTYVGPKFVSANSTTTEIELQHFFTMNSEPPLSHPLEAVPEDPIPQANMVDPHATSVDQATVTSNVYELTSTISLNGDTKLEPIIMLTLEALVRPLVSGIGHGVVLMFCTMLRQANSAYEKHNNVRTSKSCLLYVGNHLYCYVNFEALRLVSERLCGYLDGGLSLRIRREWQFSSKEQSWSRKQERIDDFLGIVSRDETECVVTQM
ncbi:unnamed protein product [Prunus brigantina]